MPYARTIIRRVAITPTVCGIETLHRRYYDYEKRWCCNNTYRLRYWNINWLPRIWEGLAASCNNTYRLRYAPKGVRQQRSKATMRPTHCLPERSEGKTKVIRQQYLSFTVLKLLTDNFRHIKTSNCCNNTYRLRYAPQSVRQQRSKATIRPTHCKYLNEVKVKQRW